MSTKYLSRTRVVYGLLILFGVVTFAQSAKQSVEQQAVAVPEPQTNANTPSRRASLRATLKSQTESAAKGEAQPASAERQLSDKERADLRQQLRQQQLAGQ